MNADLWEEAMRTATSQGFYPQEQVISCGRMTAQLEKERAIASVTGQAPLTE